ncbi:MAG TPA: MFS transporter, partial [Devosiaceae bacterium]|nr:MFS transporter [Devosiaceae bacterium]
MAEIDAGTLRAHDAAWRNIGLLAICQAIGGSNQAIIIAVAALTAATLAPDPALATVPMTATILGLALFAVPAARLVHRLGRKPAFMIGSVMAIVAGLLAAFAVWLGSFWLFCAALFGVGAAGAFVQQYRFAIADSVPAPLRGRAIALVLLGGVAAG